MKIINYTVALATWLLAIAPMGAQNEQIIETLEQSKQQIINKEKQLLKEEVEALISRQENNEITIEEAEKLKNEAAQKRALNIENKVAIIDNKIALLKRNETENILEEGDQVVLRIGSGNEEDDSFIYLGKDNTKRKYDRRTKSFLTFAVGLNNAIEEGGSLEDSNFKIGGSRFVELGLTWKTRVLQESNWVRLLYGVSFQFNALKPTDNRLFVDQDNETVLVPFNGNLDKSKFRVSNLVVPVHFEFGPSKKIEKKDYFRYSTHNQFKFGIGGYAGLNLTARQILKFEENNNRVRQKIKGDFNTSDFVYGLSAYAGISDVSLYFKYDLNPLFKNNNPQLNNVSLGLRWDWD